MKIENVSALNANLAGLKRTVEFALRKLLENGIEISSSGSEGGYLSLWIPNSEKFQQPTPVGIIACGEFPEEKVAGCFYLSHEKAYRLNSNLFLGHETSRRSMNEAKQEFPGALLLIFLQKIISFSGVKGKWDEFLSFVAGLQQYEIEFFMQNSKFPSGNGTFKFWNLYKTRLLDITQYSKIEWELMDVIIEELFTGDVEED